MKRFKKKQDNEFYQKLEEARKNWEKYNEE